MTQIMTHTSHIKHGRKLAEEAGERKVTILRGRHKGETGKVEQADEVSCLVELECGKLVWFPTGDLGGEG